MTTTESPTVDNGVNVTALLEAREAMTGTPAAAQFTWKATNRLDAWHAQPHVDRHLLRCRCRSVAPARPSPSTPTTRRSSPPRTRASPPSRWCWPDSPAASPPASLSVAQNRGVQLRSVTATLSGDMDLAGILGIDPDVRNGFNRITVTYDIDADASREEIEGIVAQSQKRSAVFDVITNPTNVRVSVV